MNPKFALVPILAMLVSPCFASPRPGAMNEAQQGYSVQYVEGDVSVSIAGKPREVEIGDILTFDAVVTVGVNSYLEFGDEHVVIGITASGSYKLNVLYAKATTVRSSDFGVMDKLKSLVVGTGTSSTVAAVRGDRANGLGGSGSGYDYGDDTTYTAEARYEKAHALLRGGDSTAAFEEFDAVAGMGEEPYASSAAYCAAVALAETGEIARAIRYLRAFSAKPDMSAYGPCVLILARLDMETGSVDEARALLESARLSGRLTAEELEMAQRLLALIAE